MGERTVSKCVLRVCSAIGRILTPIEMPPPTTAFWLRQAELFDERWQFPHCIGTIDGKHVIIVAPGRSGSMYYNYKGTHSVVLLAIVDADYRFVCVDIGAYGKNSDGGIFERSIMGRRFAADQMNVPPPSPLPGTDTNVPYSLLGDQAFALSDYMQRPYPQNQSARDPSKRNFNFRLSRARRVVENGFGILAQRWRLYFRPLALATCTVNTVVMASVLLHNFLTPTSFNHDASGPRPHGMVPLRRPQRAPRTQPRQNVTGIREVIREYLYANQIDFNN